jgi:hypothetical protein
MPLTAAQAKALRDRLGDDLADFFVQEYGIEDDGASADDETSATL